MQDIAGKCTFGGTYANAEFGELPTLHRLGIGIGFHGDPDEGNGLFITVNGPGGDELDRVELEKASNPPAPKNAYEQRITTIAFTSVVRLPVEGIYHIILREGSRIVHDRPFGVYLKSQPVAPESEMSHGNN